MRRYAPEQVDYMFAGFNAVSEEFRYVLAKTISKLPMRVVEWATEKLLFISSCKEYWAFSLSPNEWKHKNGFVFLSNDLKNESEEKQTFIITHEIAHQKLQHRSPIFSGLTQEETRRQEKEADELARKWLCYKSVVK